ncbi:MAG TPA: hypothetical protein VHQ01_05375 [Pyrinomonadaceae bacterium]|nr:hypothetical protein [Pyrinomonadaceae bacterium]
MLRKILFCFASVMTLVIIGLCYERPTQSAGMASDKVLGTGTPDKLAKWVDSDRIGDSTLTEDANGIIGVGVAPNPFFKFLVSGVIDSPHTALAGHTSGTGRGVEGSSANGIGVNGVGLVGVNGISSSTNPNDAAIRGISTFGTSLAGDFLGDVRVTGMLTKGGGSFKIDHPLDPKNKFLQHSFVESPDMMNVYNGNITTNDKGEAIVRMPDYFEALNRDFRYQLTVIGQFAQAIVSEKINGNAFKIKTDKPGVEVSWQITGIRKDKFAEEHRIQVETYKQGPEKGTLQNP